ncbi:MAG: MnhB domain-containing protein [Cyanobacteria bacterium J06638_7]
MARLIYGPAAVLLCLLPLGLALPPLPEVTATVAELLAAGRVPNMVATVILYTRLYDTVAEVVVFTLASIGVRWIFSGDSMQRRIRSLADPPSVVLCQLGATMCALVAVELALRGHLSPGGGFAAGVAGGTAIGLLLISGSLRLVDRFYNRYRADLWEKAAVVAFLLVAFLSLEGLGPATVGRFGAIASGGWIPLLNMLVALKVTLGSWAMVQLLVRYRGLF